MRRILLALVFALVGSHANLASAQWFPAPAQKVDFTAEELLQLQNEFYQAYGSDVQALGGPLEITFFKSIFSYMALATVKPDKVHQVAIMAGNLSKKTMTMDSLRLLICHEVGHFLGGGPRRIELDPNEDQTWNVVEGASDYFASTQCMKRLLKGQDHIAALLHPSLDQDMTQRCKESFSEADEVSVCERSLIATKTLIAFFAKAKEVENTYRFDTPDPSAVSSTSPSHPDLQCRMDTFLAGALCNVDPKVLMSPNDLSQGTCSNRPACWFKD